MSRFARRLGAHVRRQCLAPRSPDPSQRGPELGSDGGRPSRSPVRTRRFPESIQVVSLSGCIRTSAPRRSLLPRRRCATQCSPGQRRSCKNVVITATTSAASGARARRTLLDLLGRCGVIFACRHYWTFQSAKELRAHVADDIVPFAVSRRTRERDRARMSASEDSWKVTVSTASEGLGTRFCGVSRMTASALPTQSPTQWAVIPHE